MINRPPPLLILVIFSLSFMGRFDAAQAERQIANYKKFTAIINDDQSCSENMTVVAMHPSPDAFTKQRAQLQRLLGGVQVLLNLECPQIKELFIIGESDGKPFYSGVVSSATEWVLTDTPSPVEENIAKSPKQESQNIIGQIQEQAVNTQTESNGTECVQLELSQTKQGSVRIDTKCSSITIFDTLFDKAVRSVKDEMEKKGISFKPSRGLIKSGYSAKQLREVGLWYLKNAKNSFEYEKAFWYLSAAYFMVNKGIANISDRIHFPEEIYAGQAAAIAAAEYANPKNNVYDLGRAYSLHYDAGFLGIQSSFLAAGYIQRFRDLSEYAKRWGYHPADFISNERMLFQRATNCSEENLSRKIFPFTQELCDAAQREMLDAQRRVQVAYSKPYGDNAALWKFMGLVGLAVLAADRGAPTSAEVDTWQQSYKAEQKHIQKQINEDIDLGWAAVGTTPGW